MVVLLAVVTSFDLSFGIGDTLGVFEVVSECAYVCLVVSFGLGLFLLIDKIFCLRVDFCLFTSKG